MKLLVEPESARALADHAEAAAIERQAGVDALLAESASTGDPTLRDGYLDLAIEESSKPI